MPTPNTPPNNDDTLDSLQSIQHHLFNITDQYKEWNKLAGVNNNLTRDTTSKTTELNKLIKASLDLSSKIGKELVNQKTTKRLISSIESEANKLSRNYQNTLKDLTKEQRSQVNLLGQQQDEFKGLNKQLNVYDSEIIDHKSKQAELLDKIDALEQKGLKNSAETLALDKQFVDVNKSLVSTLQKKIVLERQSHDLNERIAASYKNQSISSALVQQAQAKAAQDVLDNVKSLPKEVEQGNKLFQKRNFLQEAFARIPFLKDLKMAPKLMEDFGASGLATLGVIGLVGASIAKMVQLMFKADGQVTDLQKQFSLTRGEAVGVRDSFFQIAKNAKDFADVQSRTVFSEQDILESQLEFNKAFGTAVMMSGQQLVQLAQVKNLIGLSEEGMKGLLTYSLGSGKAIQSIDREALGTSRVLQAQSGVQFNNKEILEEVFKVSGGIRANFKGNVAELAKAVTQAKLYGTTLENVQKTSEYLLDFESSIESELEAELLTGKQLNLERARGAALVGDTKTVMEEVTKQAGDFDHFMKYNVIQQAALAKAFGYSRDELSDMLFNQKAIEGLRRAGNTAENKSLSERYQQLVKEGHSREELANILGAETEQKLETQSAQERFNKSLQKMEDVFSDLVDGGMLQKAITLLVEGITWVGKAISATSEFFGGRSSTSPSSTGVQDSMISPKGEVMISTPRGQIKPDSGDSIITTTSPGSLLGGSTGGSNRAIEAKLDQLIAVISHGGNVYLDSKRVGTTQALAYSAYK